MTKEKIDKFLGKHVKVTFFERTIFPCEGILCVGDKGYPIGYSLKTKWCGTGYHLKNNDDQNLCFKKSHVKKIEVTKL